MVGVIDAADRYKVPPTTLLGLPYKPWGETDTMLIMAREALRAMLCTCGCGEWRDVAHDANARWDVEIETCYAAAALEQHRKNFPDPPPGQVLTLKLVTPETQASEYEEWRRKHRS